MGVNMQCQVVLLVCIEVLFVGIGMEYCCVVDVGDVIFVEKVGLVLLVSVDLIDIVCDDGIYQIYKLEKFCCLNVGICINQCLLVKVGQCVEVGILLVDGLLIDNVEFVFGCNMLVVFMFW